MMNVRRLLPSLSWLVVAAPLAQAGDANPSGVTDSMPRVEAALPGGWVGGAARVAPATDPLLSDATGTAREPDASEVYAGYRGAIGPLGYSTGIRYEHHTERRYRAPLDPALRHAMADAAAEGSLDHGEVSAGLDWRNVYARYDVTFTRDYLGLPDARGTRYLGFGTRHAFGKSTQVNFHAGNGRAGGASAQWQWRDLRAGFSRKLDDGWVMSLNYRRVFRTSPILERQGVPRPGGLVPGVRSQRGLVLTFKRGF